ncbi:MAG: DAK2 domain-containing protein, partial [Chloroflexi bacterium]|nr:DAK2 domain-containing protein [Chloroflexota bacterium]
MLECAQAHILYPTVSNANKPKAPRTPDRQRNLDGPALVSMMSSATAWLERYAQSVNALNVFPVPDGDTGTNMLLTMRSALEEARKNGSVNASAVAKAMATGALMGARGNSGVILSQIMRGLAKGMEEKERCAGADLNAGLKQASDLAVRALSQPVEGTLITVIRDVAQATEQRAADGDVADVLEAAVEAAAASVARTPELLPVLKEAGVIDAGGEGLRVLLEGALRSLRGEATPVEVGTPEAPTHPQGTPSRVPAGRGYGYCTEFLLRGTALDHAA